MRRQTIQNAPSELRVTMAWLEENATGAALARTKRAAAFALGIPPREFEKRVQLLRVTYAAPICSDSRGYWIAEDPTELLDQARRLGRRRTRQGWTIFGMQRAFEAMVARTRREPRAAGPGVQLLLPFSQRRGDERFGKGG